jgi:putative Holliday junction resolvase
MIPRGRVLGVDLGSKRIGVAISDSDQRIATGVAVLARTRDRAADHRALADLVAGYQAVGVVVGLPLSLSGQMGPAARAVAAEIGELQARLTVDVVAVDERLTTRVAAGTLRAEGRRARDQRGVIDQNAAALVLQTWVEQRRSGALEADGTGVRDR